jgi:hypothetical protein
MKIIDPTLPPCEFGPLHFEPVDDGLIDHGVVSISLGGEIIGELTQRSRSTEPITLGYLDTSDRNSGECWHLELAHDTGGIPKGHVLCVTAEPEASPPQLTRELAVWATLTVIWATKSRVEQYG